MRYPSLVHEKDVPATIAKLSPDIKWMVTEKMHGANMSFRVNPEKQSIDTYRRNGPLKPGDVFHGWEKVRDSIREPLLRLADRLSSEIVVFGELVGGYYPGCGPAVAIVQKGIYYTPNHEFIAFDIYNVEQDMFLDVDRLIELADCYGLRVIRPWYRDMSLAEIFRLEHENEVTRVPEMFDLPRIENNFIEGWIIRPEQAEPRVLLKHRTRRFFHRGEQVDVNAPIKQDPKVRNNVFIEAVKDSLTKERFEAVLSKELEIKSKSEISKYIGLVSDDILEEMEEEDRNQNAITLRIMNGMVARFVREQFEDRGVTQ